ncbi:DNA-3-methyladenine glycosylase I, partial [Streptomyces griseorubens]
MSDPAGETPLGPDGLPRCPWALSAPDYLAYHDEEWGRPVHGDDALFERLCLEAFQSGLSWITILRRRPGFRAAFSGFRIADVATFTDADRERLLADTGIIRNRAKIDATLANARVLAEWKPGELDTLIWSHAP